MQTLTVASPKKWYWPGSEAKVAMETSVMPWFPHQPGLLCNCSRCREYSPVWRRWWINVELFGRVMAQIPPGLEMWSALVRNVRSTRYYQTSYTSHCTVYALFGWLGSRVVSVPDSGSEEHGFESQSWRCRVTVLGKLFTPIVPRSTQPCIPSGSLNRVPALAGVKAGKSPLAGGR